MKRIKIFTLAIAILGLASCTTNTTSNTNENTSSTTNIALLGSWNLSSLANTQITEDFPNKLPSLTFEPVTKKFTGNSGCNNIFGDFTTNNNSLKFGNSASTKMFCEGVSETKFTQALDKANSYKISNNVLTIYDSENKELMSFTKK